MVDSNKDDGEIVTKIKTEPESAVDLESRFGYLISL